MKLDGSTSSKPWSTTTSGKMDNIWQAPLSRTSTSSPNDGTCSKRSFSQSSSKRGGWEPKCYLWKSQKENWRRSCIWGTASQIESAEYRSDWRLATLTEKSGFGLWPSGHQWRIRRLLVESSLKITRPTTTWIQVLATPWVEGSIAPHSTAWHKSSMKDYVPEVEEIASTLSSSPFAPWDERAVSILRYKKIEGATLVYIYLTYESLSKFGARISADSHILVQQTIPFNSFDAVWYRDQSDKEYYRLLITKGYEQLVLSVRGAKKIATVDRFDHLIENVAQDDSSPDKAEILKLLNIKNAHISYAPRIFPGHPKWNEAISLL